MRARRAIRDKGSMLNLVQKVQTIYAAFGRGDVPAILEHLAEDIEWEYQPVHHTVPWLQKQRGRSGAAAFFQSAGEHLDISHFAPKTFLEGPGIVAVLVDIDATVRKTGRSFCERDEVHLWHFDAAGRVVRFRHCVDTAQHQWAWGG
jgi:ketosteroid isomerase-like protein